jgi:hypothetical protein
VDDGGGRGAGAAAVGDDATVILSVLFVVFII